MTRAQAEIVELIAQLPLEERRELMEHVQESGLLGESFHERMTDVQRSQLEEGVAQADRGEVINADEAFNRLASRFNLNRT